jgi:hypothetical protein
MPLPSSDPLLFDLTAAAIELDRHPSGKKLAGAFRGITQWDTAERDLKRAHASIELLRAFDQSDPGGQHRTQSADEALVAGALFSHSVILYARAFDPQAKVRRALPTSGWFTPEQRDEHHRILKLRSEEVAHVGPSGSRRGERINREALVARVISGHTSLSAVHSIANYTAKNVISLDRLLQIALPKVNAGVAEAFQNGYEALARASAAELEIIRRHRFDPDEFYAGGSTSQGAAAFRAATKRDISDGAERLPAPHDGE